MLSWRSMPRGRPHVRHRARRHRRRRRRRGAARGQGTARGARRRTHARAGPRQRIAAHERAPLPRADRTRLRQHRDDRREQPDPLPEPRGGQYRGLPARGVVRQPRHRQHAPRRSAGARRSRREAAQANPANRSRWSGAAATRTAAGSGSRVSPPTCWTILRWAPSSPTTATSPNAWITNRGSREQMQRLALHVAHHARDRRAPGPAQHLPGGGRAASKTSCRWISAASACTTWARTGSP